MANVDQILYEASLGWGKGRIRFWDRFDQNSGFHGNRKCPLTYNGENDVFTAAAYSSLYFLIFFLSNFQTLKFLSQFLSGIVRPRRLKLGAHVDIGWMYCVYQNQVDAAYLSLYFFIFLSNFQTLKCFCHTFLRNCEA